MRINKRKRKDTNQDPDYSADLSPEEVVLKITTYEATQNPDFNLIHNAFLVEGTRAYKVAIIYEIISRNTQEFKHYVLDIISLTRLKRGWYNTYEEKFTLDGSKGEIEALFKFLCLHNNNVLPSEIGTFYALSEDEITKLPPIYDDNPQDLVHAVLENPDNYEELISQGGKDLLLTLVQVAKEQGTAVDLLSEFMSTLNELEESDKLQLLTTIKEQNLSENDLNIISGRIDGLDIFHQKLNEDNNWTELNWQRFFEENTWILGYGLDYKFLKILQREATVSSVTAGGKEAVTVDFLVGDENYTALVELKRPDTPLLKKNQNRAGSWKLSDHLIDAVSQILEQKAEWQIKGQTPQYDKAGQPINQLTIDPKAILIIGNTEEFGGTSLEDKIKSETFEIFRRNQRNIEIYTFDELYDRAKFIVSEKKKE